ncbi:MAG: hypothetical protein R6U64_10940 [Bacteroidales bacterium]
MKKASTLRLLLILLITASLGGCTSNNEFSYLANVPEYMGFAEFRASFKSSPARSIEQAGKIYLKDQYLFINELNEGIHVLDNTDPANPMKVVFYEIPGNVDIAIRGNILFADSYVDLVAIDITDIRNPVEVGRLEMAFPQVTAFPEDPEYPLGLVDYTKGVIVGWKIEQVSHTESYWNGWGWFGGRVSMDMANGGPEAGVQTGVGGSMARFILNDQFLYAITDPYVLKTLDVSDESQMVAIDSIQPWREMETLFRLDDHLFIGTTTGMMIYDVKDAAHPLFVSNLDHVNACDPVVVENDIAYVTLRSGNACNGFSNQLDVIDVADLQNPKLLKSYPMFNPFGLGIDNGTLFICDGADGLKIYDVTNPLAIQSNLIAHFPAIDTYDVIPYNKVLLMVGQDGLFQYDYSDLQDIRLLSHIEVSRP